MRRLLDNARFAALAALAALAAVTAVVACSPRAADAAPALEPPARDDAAEPANDADDAAAAVADAGRDGALPPDGSGGCGATTALSKPGPATGLELPVAAAKRSYALSVPGGYDEYRAYPLVFVLHSGGRTGASARDYFGFEAFAGEKAVFVYPDGLKGSWDLETAAARNEDVAFFDSLLAELESNLCIDTTRIFVTGSSMGAYLTNQLGCRRGDVLRAIAPHAGGGPWETGGKYDADGHLACAQKAPAAMVFIGLNDTSVDPSEGDKSVAHWSWADGCTTQTSPVAPSPCVAYQGCKNPVVSCRVPGVGHRIWAEGPKATWDFFASF